MTCNTSTTGTAGAVQSATTTSSAESVNADESKTDNDDKLAEEPERQEESTSSSENAPTDENSCYARAFKEDIILEEEPPAPTSPKRQRHKPVEIAVPMSSPKSLYVHSTIGGESFNSLVDTGCSRCLLSERAYQMISNKPPLSPTRFRFNMAQNSIPARGIVHLQVCIAGLKRTQPFFVVPMENFDCILGLDFLDVTRLEISTHDQCLKGPADLIIPLLPSKHSDVAQLRTERRHFIRPGAQINVILYGGQSVNSIVNKDRCVYLETNPQLWDKYGCMVYDGIAERGKSQTFEVAVINTTDQAVILPEEVTVALAHPIERCLVMSEIDAEDEDALQCLDELMNNAMGFKAQKDVCVSHQQEQDDFEDTLNQTLPPLNEDITEEQLKEENKDFENMIGRMQNELSPKQFVEAERYVRNYEDVFHNTTETLTQTETVEHYIDLKDGKERPIKLPPRRIPHGSKPIVEEEIEKMLEKNYIEPSNGPWASPIVLVSKKDGTTRFCVDYRRLNDATKQDAYPLPKIDECIDALSGAKYFCTLDLASGYWQVKMAARDREKTAFASHCGLYQFRVMPFGLTNAPATFQRMMDDILSDVRFKTCIVYIDDIIVYGDSYESCLANLDDVLNRLRNHGLRLKPKKCDLFKDSVTFLGHVVSRRGVSCDMTKCEKIKNWPVPVTIGDVRSFLGLVGYYRKFIDNYSNVAKPLLNLTRKDVIFKWTDECQRSFEIMRDILCSDPVLAYPDFDLPFILDTDASNFAIGAVLSQVHEDGKEHVVCYASKVLSDSQRNYCTTKRELLAVVYYTTVKFKNYLTKHKFTIRTDHLALKWMLGVGSDNPDYMCARWFSALSPYLPYATTVHRAGKKHSNADSMSRLIHRAICPRGDCTDCIKRKEGASADAASRLAMDKAISMAFGSDCDASSELDNLGDYEKVELSDSVKEYFVSALTRSATKEAYRTDLTFPTYTLEELRDAQYEDPDISTMINLIAVYPDGKPSYKVLRKEREEVKLLCKMWDELHVKDGILYRRDPDNNADRLVVPMDMREEILKELHDKPVGGHLGMTRVYETLKKRFYWPRFKKDIQRWCNCCDTCALHKKGRPRGRAPLQQEVTCARWERVAFDVIGPLEPTKRGNRFILVIVDYFTKWVEAFALPDHQAVTVARVIVNEWMSRYGCPLYLHCDQAPEFEGKVIAALCQFFNVTKTRTAPYRPQSNGLTERCNQTLESILKCYVNEHKNDWDDKLGIALMAYRATPSATTGCTPQLLVHGSEINLPIDVMFSQAMPKSSTTEGPCSCKAVFETQKSIRDSSVFAEMMTGRSQNRQKRHYDVGTVRRRFYVGQNVLWLHKPSAAHPLTQGHRVMVITKILGDVTVQCQASPTERPFTVHMDQISPHPGDRFKSNWVKEALAAEAATRQTPESTLQKTVHVNVNTNKTTSSTQTTRTDNNDKVVARKERKRQVLVETVEKDSADVDLQETEEIVSKDVQQETEVHADSPDIDSDVPEGVMEPPPSPPKPPSPRVIRTRSGRRVKPTVRFSPDTKKS